MCKIILKITKRTRTANEMQDYLNILIFKQVEKTLYKNVF